MKFLVLCFCALLSVSAFAADAPPSSCLIVKRMGPADQITSHLYSFGFRGKQFQYVEGEFPKGTKFHGRLTDNDIRKIMEHGGKIRIVEPNYTPAALTQARESCATSQQVTDSAQKSEPTKPNEAKPEAEKK